MRVGKLKNEKAAGNYKVTGEVVKLCNMSSERCIAPEDWRFSAIVPIYKGKSEKTECKNLCSVWLEKIYAGILMDRVRRVTKDLIDDEEGSFT